MNDPDMVKVVTGYEITEYDLESIGELGLWGRTKRCWRLM